MGVKTDWYDEDEDVIFGFKMEKLSYRQINNAIFFAETVAPWIDENIGKFNEDWYVSLDEKANSLRVHFEQPENMTWFQLKWLQNNDE